ncbi:MAG: (d)CMP kinase [Oscillospiraceae bacterium]|jgi:cytidylate kinase|nr:(d)CMP kinase [Oscillospiraceae bacterium]
MLSIAIDGPAAAGKSTTSKKIACKLKFLYVDTGALYRAVGFEVLNSKISLLDESSIKNLLKCTNINFVFKNNCAEVILNKKNITSLIRTEEVSMIASCISKVDFVRSFLIDIQRSISKNNNVVMEGRDIGTTILPNASLKIFLTASLNERARRRYLQLSKNKINVSYQKVLEDLKSRDENDITRKFSPLKQAKDAFFLDNTNFNLEETTEKILSLVKHKINI